MTDAQVYLASAVPQTPQTLRGLGIADVTEPNPKPSRASTQVLFSQKPWHICEQHDTRSVVRLRKTPRVGRRQKEVRTLTITRNRYLRRKEGRSERKEGHVSSLPSAKEAEGG